VSDNTRPNTVPAWARQIVLQRAAIVGALTAALHALVVFGLLSDTAGVGAVNWTGRIIDALGIVIGLAAIHVGVTPADPKLAPRASDGRPLVPAPRDGLGVHDITSGSSI
jgi:hypothetical protein